MEMEMTAIAIPMLKIQKTQLQAAHLMAHLVQA
jgi:hypothetical protein